MNFIEKLKLIIEENSQEDNFENDEQLFLETLNENSGQSYTNFDLLRGNIVVQNPWPNPIMSLELDVTHKLIRKKYKDDYSKIAEINQMLSECTIQFREEEQALIDSFEKDVKDLGNKYKKLVSDKIKGK